MKKRNGSIGILFPVFCLLFLLSLMAYRFQLYSFDIIKADTEDALAASNLASAVIDVEEYGISHNLIIAVPDEAYAIYKDALKVNMGLDDTWCTVRETDITGPVTVVDYIIYNVRNNDVEIHYYGQNRYSQTITGGLGTVTAPNGKVIESTSIYSKITFPVDGIWGVHVIAVKDKLVDIVA